MEDLDSNAAGENMGSLRFARNASKNREKLYGMISLESIGYFTEDSKSQEFLKALGFRQKFPFKQKQTSRGDFVAFVGNFQSHSFLKNCEAAFKRTATVTKSGVQATAKLGAAIAGIDTKVGEKFWNCRRIAKNFGISVKGNYSWTVYFRPEIFWPRNFEKLRENNRFCDPYKV